VNITKAKNIELVPLDALTPYDKNARLHTRSQIEKIAKSIKAFGFNNPILIDADQGIIAGHGRLEAAKLLELESVPVIRLDHLNEKERQAYILADNRLADLSQWDEELLGKEVAALQEAELDLDALGWSEDELAALVAGLDDIEPTDEALSSIADESEPETKSFRFQFDVTDFAELSEMLDTLTRRYKLEDAAETFEHLVRGAHG
jgi:ParB-like chromosome segregation protein Spo0J